MAQDTGPSAPNSSKEELVSNVEKNGKILPIISKTTIRGIMKNKRGYFI